MTEDKRLKSESLWLVKQEPEDYSWDDLVRDGKTSGRVCAIFRRATT